MKRKSIIYLLFIMVATLSMASCSKEQGQVAINKEYPADAFASAQTKFAKILSSALYEDKDLRTFIKNEALKMFDNDYDVFYPFVKNAIVSDNRTFEDILVSYCESPDDLDRIETVIPKLTILVPDWSWVDEDCFSVNSWDTSSDDVFVGISGDSSDRVIYLNGEQAGKISDDVVPCSPVVIIKSNERMRVVTPATRGNDATFDFVYDAYDGRNKQPETRSHYSDIEWNYDKSGESDFAPASDLPNMVIKAAEEFKYNNNTTAQRDYIYYGMSQSNKDAGVLDNTIKEYVYRFKIDKEKLTMLDYKNSSDVKQDPSFLPESIVFKKKKNKLDPDSNDIQKYIWSEGSLEISFTFYLGNYGSNVLSSYKVPLTIQPSELWEVKTSTERRETCGTVFHYKYFSSKDDLVSKWYYPKDFPVQPFNLANNSTQIWFSIYEEDPSGTIETTVSHSCSYTTNVKRTQGSSVNAGYKGEKISFGLQYSQSEEDSSTTQEGSQSSLVIRINEGSDFLGDGCLDYMAPIINSSITTKDGVKGYYLKSIPTAGDQVMVTFVPKHNY